MLTHEFRLRVRYAETDQMGYVYYGNYAVYYEVARVEMLRALGLRYKDLESTGILMPVLENKSKYIRPARYDDLLTIKTFVRHKPQMRIRFDYEIFNEEQALIHTGETTLVFFDAKTSKAVHAPLTIMRVIEPHFKQED